jgi:hypothetical protein
MREKERDITAVPATGLIERQKVAWVGEMKIVAI